MWVKTYITEFVKKSVAYILLTHLQVTNNRQDAFSLSFKLPHSWEFSLIKKAVGIRVLEWSE